MLFNGFKTTFKEKLPNPPSFDKWMNSGVLKRERTQALLTDAGLFAESIVDTVREPILILGPDLRIVRANRSFYKVFNGRSEETEGFPLSELNHGQWNIPMLQRLLEDIQKNHTNFDNFEIKQNFSRLGKRSMLLNARSIYSSTGETQLILLAMEDITDRKQVEETLRELSLTDELTNLYNRRGFLDLAEDRAVLLARVEKNLKDVNLHGVRNYKLSLSMGACHFAGSDSWSVDSMMVRADKKLYELKKLNMFNNPINPSTPATR